MCEEIVWSFKYVMLALVTGDDIRTRHIVVRISSAGRYGRFLNVLNTWIISVWLGSCKTSILTRRGSDVTGLVYVPGDSLVVQGQRELGLFWRLVLRVGVSIKSVNPLPYHLRVWLSRRYCRTLWTVPLCSNGRAVMSRSGNFVVRVASRSLQLGRRRPATATASSVLLYRLIFTSGVATRPPTTLISPLQPRTLQYPTPL